jgi:hypothetical protein
MKIQKNKEENNQQSSQQQSNIPSTPNSNTGQIQITPAKRQKMDWEEGNNAINCQIDHTRVGLAQQASPKQ